MGDPAHEETEKLIKQMEKRIKKEYQKAVTELQGTIDDYFRRFELKDKKWREWVADGTKTKKEYEQWRIGQMAVGDRWKSMKNTIAEDLAHTEQIAKSIAKGYMPEVYAVNFNYGTYEVEHSGGVDTGFTLYNRESVERIIQGNPDMLPAPGKKVKQAIAEGKAVVWNKQLVQSTMIQGILLGESIPKLAKRLARDVADKDYKASIRNARTMATSTQNAGRYDAYRRAEAKGIEMEVLWRATLDNRTRHSHRQLDGQKRPLDEPFEVDGFKILYPGQLKPNEETHFPQSMIWNCRCTLRGVVKGLEPRAIKYRDMSAINNDYEAWKEGKSVSEPITAQSEKGEAIANSYKKEYARKIKRSADDVTRDYVEKATPGIGRKLIEEGFNPQNHDEELSFADWVLETFGGDIKLLRERTFPEVEKGHYTSDYLWNNKMWELKTISSSNKNTIDKHIKHGNEQISLNRGGIFIDITNGELDISEMANIIRGTRRINETTDVLIRKGDRYKVMRIKRE